MNLRGQLLRPTSTEGCRMCGSIAELVAANAQTGLRHRKRVALFLVLCVAVVHPTVATALVVNARPQWTDSTIDIASGAPLDITATGGWTFKPEIPFFGPDGDGVLCSALSTCDGEFLTTAPVGALVAFIGPPLLTEAAIEAMPQNQGFFLVGSHFSGSAPATGRLYLGFNADRNNYTGDNSGFMTITFAAGGCPGDSDCDGIPDSTDNCPDIPNSIQGHCARAPGSAITDSKRCSNALEQICNGDKDCAPQADRNPRDGIGDACETGWRMACGAGTNLDQVSWISSLALNLTTLVCDDQLANACTGLLFLNDLRRTLLPSPAKNYARVQLTYAKRQDGSPGTFGLLKAQMIKADPDSSKTGNGIGVVIYDLDDPSRVYFEDHFAMTQWRKYGGSGHTAPEYATFPVGFAIPPGVNAAMTMVAWFDETGKNPWCAVTSHMGVAFGYDDQQFDQKVKDADPYVAPYICQRRSRWLSYAAYCGNLEGLCGGSYYCTPNGNQCTGVCGPDPINCLDHNCCLNEPPLYRGSCHQPSDCDAGTCAGGTEGLDECNLAWEDNAREGFARRQYACDAGTLTSTSDPSLAYQWSPGSTFVNGQPGACQCEEFEGPTDGDAGGVLVDNVNDPDLSVYVYPPPSGPPLWWSSDWHWQKTRVGRCRKAKKNCQSDPECGPGDRCKLTSQPGLGW